MTHLIDSVKLQNRMSSDSSPLLHRDQSWLQFNDRVLDEAKNSTNPLLERLKFLAISASNLDEYFMIRIASIENNIRLRLKKLALGEAKSLSRIRGSILYSVKRFELKQATILKSLVEELKKHDIQIAHDLPNSKTEYEEPFFSSLRERILPLLPNPEPFSWDELSKIDNLQTILLFKNKTWIRIPKSLPTVFSSYSNNDTKITYFFLDQVLAALLNSNDPENGFGFIRVTRDSDYILDIESNDPESIPDIIRNRINTREKGQPIRLQYWGNFDQDYLESIKNSLKLSNEQLFPTSVSLYLNGLWTVVNETPPHFTSKETIQYSNAEAKLPEVFLGKTNLFEKLKQRDILLHHPYDSFDAFIQFMRAASEDPEVIQIEQTVYRMDTLSPVIGILKNAALNGKKVIVLIELRARFDESNNLLLTEELKKSGVIVRFGFGKLKLHAKVALITRKEGDTIKHYTHLSTGNYNAKTARQYTDLALLTANTEIGDDARHFFDRVLAGVVPQTFKQLVVAPTRLSKKLQSLIKSEADAAKAGKKARIVAKVNALVDDGIIKSLYAASQDGVQVDLIVRGACSLLPQIKGISENIRVISIIDHYLEHSRIYFFENAEVMYLSSADWMPRNFFSRLEIAFPILDPKIYLYLKNTVLPAYLSDTVKAKELQSDGTWKSLSNLNSKEAVRSQLYFKELATDNYKGTPLA